MVSAEAKKRRVFGQHFTPVKIFEEYIFPFIEKDLNDYVWVDLFSGEGNLILPILKHVPKEKRVSFFENNIFLFDIQERIVEKAIDNAVNNYGIPREIASKNIICRDT
jgi:hypothetical protein